jgi:DNA-binding CsgD family transcriptional regulator
VASGQVELGRPRLEAARGICRDAGDRVGEARAVAVLGLACIIEGDFDQARQLVDAALAVYRAEGDQWGQGQANTYLGIICEDIGDEAGATRHNRSAIDCFRPFRDSTLLPTALASQASVLAVRDSRRALKVVAAARAIKTRDGGDFPAFFRMRADHAEAVAEAAVGEEAAACWKEGTRLDREEAIALAFGNAASRPAPVSGLSEREQEVARLVADGLANKTIAAQLHVSVRTVESHVRHVLTKLGLSNRTQLATWARDRLR